jgi:hypothetical protein
VARAFSWAGAAAIVAVCGLCGWGSFRTWRASADVSQAQAIALTRGGAATEPYLALASRYRPGQAKTWRLRARFAEFGHPELAMVFARRAVSVDPMDWRNWDRLGLIEFQLGDASAARRALREAVRFDSGWEAHYRLGNLALLLGDKPEYWIQMKATLAVVASTQAWPVLEEALSVAGDSPGRLAAALPRRRAGVDGQAIVALLNARRALAAVEVWRRMQCPGYARASCRAAALRLTNALADQAMSAQRQVVSPVPDTGAGSGRRRDPSGKLIRQAVEIWNRAVHRGLLQASPVRLGEVNDGRFQGRWVGPAFSWAGTPGISMDVEPSGAPEGNAVRIGFDGYQPQKTSLLRQLVPVNPGTDYEVSFLSRRQVAGSQTGVMLAVETGGLQSILTLRAALRLRWGISRADFRVPRRVHVVCLCFRYQRPLGQVRLRDPVLIAEVRLRRFGP